MMFKDLVFLNWEELYIVGKQFYIKSNSYLRMFFFNRLGLA